MTELVVGATGNVGRLVVAEAPRQGHSVRALVRDRSNAHRLALKQPSWSAMLRSPMRLAAQREDLRAHLGPRASRPTSMRYSRLDPDPPAHWTACRAWPTCRWNTSLDAREQREVARSLQ